MIITYTVGFKYLKSFRCHLPLVSFLCKSRSHMVYILKRKQILITSVAFVDSWSSISFTTNSHRTHVSSASTFGVTFFGSILVALVSRICFNGTGFDFEEEQNLSRVQISLGFTSLTKRFIMAGTY